MSDPTRSILYVPASRPRFFTKIPSTDADLVLIDLEDGVAPAAKAEARDNVRNAVAAGLLDGARPWMLRVNSGPLGPPPEDLTLVGFARPAFVVVPKAEDPGAVRGLAARFADHGATTALMIETAGGVACCMELLACHPSVGMAILGSADLRVSLQARPDPHRVWERHAMSQVLLAARRYGRLAIDSVYFRYQDAEGLRAHALVARELGYDGKSCIHPAQVAVIHDVYASTPDERDWALRVLSAWTSGSGSVNGVAVMDGEMIEALHVGLAERILAR